MIVPFKDVSDLEQSELYKKNKTLQSLSPDKLSKFVNVFNSVYERVLRNKGTQAEAESQAISIALSTAKKFKAASAHRKLEASVHYFAPMSLQMRERDLKDQGLSAQDYSFEFVKREPELANLIASGFEFNFEHDHDLGLGVIHKLITVSEAPPEIQAKTDKETPFLFVASYYEDVPQTVKENIKISAEWLGAETGGKPDAIPLTFAITEQPLNPVVLGVKKVASDPAEANLYKHPGTAVRSGQTPMAEIAELEASLASKNKEVDELKAKVASLSTETGAKDQKISELSATILAREASDFAASLSSEGKIPTDAVKDWAGAYIGDKNRTVALSKTLRASTVPTGDSKAAGLGALADKDSEIKKMALEAIKKVN